MCPYSRLDSARAQSHCCPHVVHGVSSPRRTAGHPSCWCCIFTWWRSCPGGMRVAVAGTDYLGRTKTSSGPPGLTLFSETVELTRDDEIYGADQRLVQRSDDQAFQGYTIVRILHDRVLSIDAVKEEALYSSCLIVAMKRWSCWWSVSSTRQPTVTCQWNWLSAS